MKTEYTPGPWRIERLGGTLAVDGGELKSRPIFFRAFPDEQDEANARLVAAAPLLLEACEAVLSACCYTESIDDDGRVLKREVYLKIEQDVYDILLAAIHAATE